MTTTTKTTSSSSSSSSGSAVGVYKRSRQLFNTGHAATAFLPATDPVIYEKAVLRRKVSRGFHQQPQQSTTINNNNINNTATSTALVPLSTTTTTTGTAVVNTVGAAAMPSSSLSSSSALTVVSTSDYRSSSNDINNNYNNNGELPAENRILTRTMNSRATAGGGGGGGVYIPTPVWHAPWKLTTVLSSHLGWVRCIATDPTNTIFATGSADRTIKIWNLAAASAGLADSALQYTLTGHISAVRGLVFSEHHPYLFSCAEDKQVKCWDLTTNQVVRHYHGHLSGVYCAALHPAAGVNVLVTGGRDAVARVWDIRSKQQIHCLSGHDHTVATVLVQSMHPSIITGSHDTTVRMWDLVAGKCVTVLTHHTKSIRTMVQPAFERTFLTGAADGLKKFQAKDGKFIQTMTGHKSAIIHAMAVNDDGVTVSTGDDGSMHFWDYATGYCFQQAVAAVQPGSLESENAVLATHFDKTGTRLITGEADKTIKIYKPDEAASELTHPINMTAWRKKCIAQSKQRV